MREIRLVDGEPIRLVIDGAEIGALEARGGRLVEVDTTSTHSVLHRARTGRYMTRAESADRQWADYDPRDPDTIDPEPY